MRQDSELIRRADGTWGGQWGLEGPVGPGGAGGGWRSKQTWRGLLEGNRTYHKSLAKLRHITTWYNLIDTKYCQMGLRSPSNGDPINPY